VPREGKDEDEMEYKVVEIKKARKRTRWNSGKITLKEMEEKKQEKEM
jgi:hypothetical protein